MKTKAFDKKGKKRSHESFLSTKPDQKQKIDDFNKNAKKAKLATSAENGNFTATNTVQFSKQIDKQGKKKNKDVKQSNIEASKIEKKTHGKEFKSTNIEPEVKVFNKKKREKLENLKKEPELHKERQVQKSHVTSTTQNVEQLKKRIEEIQSREVLTKSAKRKLGMLKKKLLIEESKNNLEKSDTIKEKINKQNKPQGTGVSVKNKEKINKDKKELGKKSGQTNKGTIKPDDLESDIDESDTDVSMDLSMDNLKEDDESDEIEEEDDVVKDDEDDDEDDEDDDDDDDDEDDEDAEDDFLVEKEKAQNKMDVDDEETTEDEDDKEDVEDEEVEIDEEDEDDEDEEDEDDEDEEDEEDTDKESINKKDIPEKKEKKGVQPSDRQKKEAKNKRYVLFVNNIPYDTTPEELKQHFLTKVKTVLSIRIPTESDGKPRGFAYVELKDDSDFVKGLQLHHTFIKKRRINVKCAVLPSKDKKTDVLKKVAVAKTKKLHALQKAGKLTGGFQDKKTQKKKYNISKA